MKFADFYPWFSRTILTLLIISLPLTWLWGQQGLIVNEVSNGPSGAKEFFELVVVGTSSADCGMDLRGWLIDDNNGDFSCGPRTGAGIAQGHIRFNPTDLNWSSVPMGAMIVIYNDADVNAAVPAADPTDSNGDLIYIVPVSHSSIEQTIGTNACTGTKIPVGCSSCPGSGNAGYGGPYGTGGNWASMGLRNSGGDAAQVRDPSGTYHHGISYGSTNMTGGPDNLLIATGSGSGRNFFFSGGDYRNVANWTRGSASTNDSPGLANDASNTAFLAALQSICILPVEFSEPLLARKKDGQIKLTWKTSEEITFDRFIIERADEDDQEFKEIATLQGGISDYEFWDTNFDSEKTNWYRLRLIDQDGSFENSRIASVYFENPKPQLSVTAYPNPASEQLNFIVEGVDEFNLFVVDLYGKVVLSTGFQENQFSIPVSNWAEGIYMWQIRSPKGAKSGKIVVRK